LSKVVEILFHCGTMSSDVKGIAVLVPRLLIVTADAIQTVSLSTPEFSHVCFKSPSLLRLPEIEAGSKAVSQSLAWLGPWL